MMHEDQIPLSDTHAAELIISQFPHYRGERISRLKAAGTVNTIYRVGERTTARFPLRNDDPQRLYGVLRSEALAMEEFRTASPFPGPEPLGIGRPSEEYPLPWSLQGWLSGQNPTPSSHEDSPAFAADLAELVAGLRAHPVRGRTFAGGGRGGSLRTHEEWMQECLRRSEGLLDVPRLGRLWARFRELPEGRQAVMSHRDLIPGNLLVDGRRLAAVLDTGDFGPADPALDLVAAWHLLDGQRRPLFRELLDVDEAEWRRGAAWAFEQAMGLVWYYRESNPPMSELGTSTLDRILADGSL
ncbi:aminoglycoside phosphotransferase family protein [Arthrobacter sp. NPDC090010]|uniref:aminoglycoside phosphotransferase family protein n=1 Tax=Arthrobacter sp. NPDC090010 TaxID=3363942 RepID=UPI0038032A45